MPKITIELELGPGYEQDPETGEFYPTDRNSFDEQVISRVVEAFASRLDYDGVNKLNTAVVERADKLIRDRLSAEIEKVALGPLQKYDYMGKPTGEPFTVSELIVQAVEKFANAPATPDNGYGSNSDQPKNLTEIVEQAVASALREELSSDVNTIRGAVAADIKNRLSSAVADAVVRPR